MQPGKDFSYKKEFIGQKCLLFTVWIRAGFQCILEGTGGREQKRNCLWPVFVAPVPALTAKTFDCKMNCRAGAVALFSDIGIFTRAFDFREPFQRRE